MQEEAVRARTVAGKYPLPFRSRCPFSSYFWPWVGLRGSPEMRDPCPSYYPYSSDTVPPCWNTEAVHANSNVRRGTKSNLPCKQPKALLKGPQQTSHTKEAFQQLKHDFAHSRVPGSDSTSSCLRAWRLPSQTRPFRLRDLRGPERLRSSRQTLLRRWVQTYIAKLQVLFVVTLSPGQKFCPKNSLYCKACNTRRSRARKSVWHFKGSPKNHPHPVFRVSSLLPSLKTNQAWCPQSLSHQSNSNDFPWRSRSLGLGLWLLGQKKESVWPGGETSG